MEVIANIAEGNTSKPLSPWRRLEQFTATWLETSPDDRVAFFVKNFESVEETYDAVATMIIVAAAE